MPSLKLKCITSTERYLLKEDRFTYTYVFMDILDSGQTLTIHSDANYGYAAGQIYEIVPTKESNDGS